MLDQPHRRRNLLNGKWVLVSPHRLSRPWLGQSDEPEPPPPDYDPECYLCPGNKRITGERNPDYQDTYVFKNDFSALVEQDHSAHGDDLLFQALPTSGECHVICFSPDHGKTLGLLSQDQLRSVVDQWCQLSKNLGQKYRSVQIFENKGAMMGCSNPHPHGQVWAADHIPDEISCEEEHQRAYWDENGQSLLTDVAIREVQDKERIVVESEYWLAIVPFWASWPFETLLLPKFAVQRIDQLFGLERQDLARMLSALTIKYDNLFQCSFPYSMGWHGAPYRSGGADHWQLHAHFYPPLLRGATVRKFMVGYEMLAEAQRDLTPEKAAEMLRDTSDTHYLRAG